MKTTLQSKMATKKPEKKTTNIITFYGERNQYGEFSNFFSFPQPIEYIVGFGKGKNQKVVIDNSETSIMLEKASLMGDKDIFEQLKDSKNPSYSKKLGRKIKNFDEKLWEKERPNVALYGLTFKFTSFPMLRDKLISTKNAILVEAAPYDRIWGVGMRSNDPNIRVPKKWKGQNILGFTLMNVRENISHT